MPKTRSESLTDWQEGFLSRTRQARMRKFDDAKSMAKALGIGKDRYYKYETRTPLPHELVEQFCLITGVSVSWLFTGSERKAA